MFESTFGDIVAVGERFRIDDMASRYFENRILKIRLKRGSSAGSVAGTSDDGSPLTSAPLPAAAAPAPLPPPPAPVSNEVEIKSPMIGTFYRAPSPESAPYVEVGTEVSPETVVCIIEAMKVMNEIKAEAKGVLTQVMVENAKPVEFGQPLFKLRPN